MKTQKAPKTFLSYVRADKDRTINLYKQLQSAGLNPWMDTEDLLPGEPWKARIEQAIRESNFFIACLSKNSVSKRGFLQREIKKALDLWREKLPDDIYLIPVRLEECDVPESLAEFHWVDLFQPGGWDRVLRSIRAGMKRRAQASEHATAAASKITQSNQSSQPHPETKAVSLLPKGERRELPLITFPHELAALLEWVTPDTWQQLDDSSRRMLITLGTKLEPILQIIPRTPIPLVTGFECLALGALGETFPEICQRATSIDPGHLRLLLALSSMKTAETLRVCAEQGGNFGARNLRFTLNVDNEMLGCHELEEFLERYRRLWEEQFFFEITERITSAHLRRLLDLQADFKLRYCADDYNCWDADAKTALRNNVEITKMDCSTFHAAMDVRGSDPQSVIAQLRLHQIGNKPLIVEGLENENYLRFLSANWPERAHDQLLGQGYKVRPGQPWENWTADLRAFGLPGGHILSNIRPATPLTSIPTPAEPKYFCAASGQ